MKYETFALYAVKTLMFCVLVLPLAGEPDADHPTPFPDKPKRTYDPVTDTTVLEAGATLPKGRKKKKKFGLSKLYDKPKKQGANVQFGIRASFNGKKPKSMNDVKVHLSFYFHQWKTVSRFNDLDAPFSSAFMNNPPFVYGRAKNTPLNCLAYTGPGLDKPKDTLRVSLAPEKKRREKTNAPPLSQVIETRKRIKEKKIGKNETRIIEREYHVLTEPVTFKTKERIFYEPITGSKALKLFSHNLALRFPFGKTATLPKKLTEGLENILNNLRPER